MEILPYFTFTTTRHNLIDYHRISEKSQKKAQVNGTLGVIKTLFFSLNKNNSLQPTILFLKRSSKALPTPDET